MKLHYYKIFLFSLPLNILVISRSYDHNNNKPYITPSTSTTTSRVLSECDLYVSSYDNDPDMKSVKENFDRQTSQRFEEYNERMNDKRQKCKEQCDKDIQQIIVKDKVQKSLAEKVERGCLRCGCALGGGIVPVWGLVSGLWYATLSQYVSTTLVKMATDAGIAEGVKVGLLKVTELATTSLRGSSNVPAIEVLQKITAGISAEDVTLSGIFKTININACGQFDTGPYAQFSTWIQSLSGNQRIFTTTYFKEAEAVSTSFNKAQTAVLAKGTQATSSLTTAIIASVVAIVVIVLVMVIIYLILRYRRKKKMTKKLQYTKLLKE